MSIKKDNMDWSALRHGICPRYECLSLNTLKENDAGDIVFCDRCGFRMSASKLYGGMCKKGTYSYYKIKNKSRSEEDRMKDICLLQ